MNEEDLKKRTQELGLRIIKLVAALPKNIEGRAIGNQLIRAGTSVGANYRAACRARSKAEFISRLGIVEEEADESAFWMELIIQSQLMKAGQVESLLREASELGGDHDQFTENLRNEEIDFGFLNFDLVGRREVRLGFHSKTESKWIRTYDL